MKNHVKIWNIRGDEAKSTRSDLIMSILSILNIFKNIVEYKILCYFIFVNVLMMVELRSFKS